MNVWRLTFTCMLLVALTGCVSKPPEERLSEAEEMYEADEQRQASRRDVPAEVRAQLRQGLGEQQQRPSQLLEEPRFSVQARQMPADDFFAQLTDETPYSVVLHPDVEGTITLNMRDVTLAETLDVVEDIYGFDIRREGRVYRVFPAGLRTETVSLNYLSLQRRGMSQTAISSGGVAQQGQTGAQRTGSTGAMTGAQQIGMPGAAGQQGALGQMGTQGQTGSMIFSENETDFWKDLQEALMGIIGEGDGRHVVVSPQSGLATIRAHPHEIRAAKDFLAGAEESLQRQVVLEARIVEVNLSEQYQQGVDWSRITSRIGSGVTEFSFSGGNVDGGSLGGVMGLSFENQTFNGMLELLSTQGNVQVLSNPRVTATNNQKAVIKIGEDEYYVTDVSTTTVTGTATTTTPNIQLTPFFSGIALDVTPQIGEDDSITLHVRPSVTETEEQEKTVRLNQETFQLPLARSNIRETDTIIRAQDGEVIVIGGLMQTSSVEDTTSVPFFGDIPVLGELFTNRRQREEKKELIIMLRPTVVKANTWETERERSRDLLRRWHDAQ